jgi:hypothetical protein
MFTMPQVNVMAMMSRLEIECPAAVFVRNWQKL